MTDAERFLWRRLRGKQIYGLPFYRQKPLGSYIVDFYCPAAKIVIEVDGSQHAIPVAAAYDMKRDDYMRGQGLTVMRFNDRQVLCEGEGVMETIGRAVSAARETNLPQSPFCKGGGEWPFLSKNGGKQIPRL